MSRRVLLVFSPEHRDWRNRIEAHLDDEATVHGAEAIDVDTAPTVEAAARKFEELRYDLVVADLSLMPGAGAPVSDRGGLLLLESLRDHPDTRRMLVVPGFADDIEKRCAALAIPTLIQKFESNLAEQVSGALRAKPAATPPLNVIIRARQTGDWSYELHDGTSSPPAVGTLHVTEEFSDMLEDLSDGVQNAGNRWKKKFSRLGKNLIGHFCGADNPKFGRDIRAALEQAQRVENTRVSFVVEPSHHNIALEALMQPGGPLPWMVRAPLFRNLAGSEPLSPRLFSGARRMRALIVCADASGFVNGQTDEDGNVQRYPKLGAVQKECQTLMRMFSELQRKGEPIEASPFPSPGLKRVERGELLRRLEEQWDIVHIAGHSKYLEREKRGVLIVGGDDSAVELDIAEVTPFLAKARLLYLSSCESANAPFAVAAAQAGVRAVVGFRWPVNDRLAAMHARLFYRSLFKRQSLEVAFLRTRRAMHRRFENDPIWASSMLVMGGN